MSTNGEPNEKTEIQASTLDANLRRKLHSLCTQYREQSAAAKLAKEAQDAIRESIEDIVSLIPADRIIGNGWKTVRSTKTYRTVNATKLVELGVDLEIVQQATDEKKIVSIAILANNPQEK